MKKFTIPSTVVTVGNDAFNNCSSLMSLTILDGVMNIEDYAFQGCSKLTNVSIPDSVGVISYKAFDGCTSLKNVTIGKGVHTIESYSFYGCDNIKGVYYPGSEEEWNDISIDNGNDPLLKAEMHFNSRYTAPDLLGDVNLDGEIDASDATIILQKYAGIITDDIQKADVNEDGAINSTDATLVLQKYAGIIKEF